MAEPQPKPDDPQGAPKLAPASPSPPSSPESGAAAASDCLLNSAVGPTDDTPTIISRTAALRPEDALARVLRGRHLAHFELLEPIGVGGMAAVIRARDLQLDRNVALKILPPEMASDPENVRRFHQEARAAAKLDHENIARVFFCGEDQGLHLIAFEFVEGENLRTLLERRGRIPVPEAIAYLLQVATGLAHASARGVVHRDIKPSNIIISSTGRAKLVDMGLARSLGPQNDGPLTQSGVTLGTFDYISPEQALEPREADVRSDIYSLGCTFYHMITGQPPVPEGTAAKKLHHHHHVNPLDPRQLNPDIPDEVAALLAHMMAKDPKDRYQSPEHLVQHLIGLAQKLGATADVPEGITLLFESRLSETPLPGPPRIRPIFIAVSAVLALLALIALLGPPPSSSSPAKQGGAPPVAQKGETTPQPDRKVPTDEPHPLVKPDELAPVQDSPTATFYAKDGKSLHEFLKKARAAKILLTTDINLTREDQLVFQGLDLTIEPAEPQSKRPPTISVQYDSLTVGEPWAALTIKSGRVVIRGVRFEVDAHEADIVMTAVDLQGGKLTLEKCEFAQPRPANSETGHVSSITLNRSPQEGDAPVLTLRECFFLEGQRAVTLNRAGTVRCDQCAFGPHTATLFDLHAESSPEADLQIHNCSAFVSGGAVFQLTDRASCRLKVENCIFSQPESNPLVQGFAALVEQTGKGSGEFRYSGSHNCYHNLTALWKKSSGQELPEVIKDLKTFSSRTFVEDEKSIELANSPWEKPQPLAWLQSQPRSAFRINTSLPELRQEDATKPVGVERCVWGESYDGKLPLLGGKKPAESVVQKIVDPAAPTRRENVYQTLRQALEDVKAGDVIFIRHNGPLAVDPVTLEKAGMNVTIKPFLNCHPMLTIGQTPDTEAALFRVYDGQLKLEELEFHLVLNRTEFKSQTVVAVMADGRCAFSNCVVTLGGTKDRPVSLVTLADPSGVMKMDPQAPEQQVPAVVMERCFVRGTGNLIAVRASRPCDITVEDSLVALDGSFLVVDGNAKDPSARAGYVVMSLKQVTTFLTEHLVWLRASREEGRNSKGLVQTQIRSATSCLFVSATDRSLIHLDGVDSETQTQHLLSWEPGRHNAYCNFKQYLDQQPLEEARSGMMPPLPKGKNEWREFTKEQDGKFVDRRPLTVAFAPEGALEKVAASDFKLKPETNLQGYGVDSEHLPKPSE